MASRGSIKGGGRKRSDIVRSYKEFLLRHALLAQKRAYSRWSKFSVGAALLVRDGRTYLGCNVENASYGATICAERTAIVSAIADGVRPEDMIAVAVVGPAKEPITPCGICRQFMAEFSPPKDPIVVFCLSAGGEQVIETNLTKLLPRQFPSPEDIRIIGR